MSESTQVKPRSLWPKEHGAYAETALPIATGLVMSRAAPAAVTFAVATVAAFLAHEPLLVFLGHRGERARRDHGLRARRRAVVLGLVAFASGLVAVGLAPQEASLWIFVPVSLAALLVPRVLGGTEKTLAGELLAGLALTSMVLPIGLAGGVTGLPLVAAAAVAWALTFTIGNLAVRAITRPRERRAAGEEAPPSLAPGSLRGRMDRNLERTITLVLSGWTIVAAGAALAWLPISVWGALALLPGAAAGVVLGVKHISARSLRQVGWALVATYTVTLALLIVASLTDL